MAFIQPQLGYDYNALEPHIDARQWRSIIPSTMQPTLPI